MKMLYTANGRYIRCCTEEGSRPVIIVCEKEYEVDVQEFIVWSILNWRILREEEIGSYYEKMVNNTNAIHRSWQDCVQAVREYHCSREVITAVANLYLRQQIMIDTY